MSAWKKKTISGPACQLCQTHVQVCQSAPSYSGSAAAYKTPVHMSGFKTRALTDILITTHGWITTPRVTLAARAQAELDIRYIRLF